MGMRRSAHSSCTSAKHRALGHAEAHQQADSNQYGACQKRDAPGPSDKLLACDGHRGNEEHEIRQDDADRKPEGNEAAVPSPSLVWRVLDRHQRGAAPFPAESETLFAAKGVSR